MGGEAFLPNENVSICVFLEKNTSLAEKVLLEECQWNIGRLPLAQMLCVRFQIFQDQVLETESLLILYLSDNHMEV
ncbi:MAG TPA: hypothetical protein PKB02_01455 [Anaerohalosphaeraceae bacterium]|nr:hypothetical protein [Anaerohalosphaeraceae bacterium]